MTQPLVSVKMITYNHAAFIDRAIRGVLQQKTIFPFELVIGEDYSTDGTRDTVFKYQKQYPDMIRVVTSDHNVGATKNSYRTLKACKGKYVAYCEGDDFWQHDGKLQKQADYLKSHPECGILSSSYDVYYSRTKKLVKDYVKYRKLEMPQNIGIYDILENIGGISHGILTCTIMVRKALTEEIIESDPYLHQNERFLMGDTQLWAEIAAKSSLHYMTESLATHVITEESATRSKDIKKVLRFGVSNAEMMLYLCGKYGVQPNVRMKYEDYWCDRALRLAYYTRNEELADEIRKRKRIFTTKEWLRYHGAKHLVMHGVYIVAAVLSRLIEKKRDQWF